MPIKKPQTIPFYSSSRFNPRFNKVVIVDDSDVDLFINETILSAAAISREISRESRPENLIKQLQNIDLLKDVPELIFLDLKMNSMSGLDFLAEFSQLSDFVRNKCKIVIVTSSTEKDDKQRALLNPSVVRYLIKPLDIHQLKEFINY
jgi:two-component SAPR family response regulator